jgi:hypothetical protein
VSAQLKSNNAPGQQKEGIVGADRATRAWLDLTLFIIHSRR